MVLFFPDSLHLWDSLYDTSCNNLSSYYSLLLVLGFNLIFFLVRGCRPGKSVQMTEAEVRGLCLKSREIFLQQPILLELEAPLKICGKEVFSI